MCRKIFFLAVMGSLFLVCSCKKETPAPKKSTEKPLVHSIKVDKRLKSKENLPVMTFEEKVHDFGTITSGDVVVNEFKFTNTGKTDLVIANAVGTCGCTVPEFSKEPIKPGESGKIKVSFSTIGKLGEQSKSVRITANTYKGRERIKIKAMIKPRVEK